MNKFRVISVSLILMAIIGAAVYLVFYFMKGKAQPQKSNPQQLNDNITALPPQEQYTIPDIMDETQKQIQNENPNNNENTKAQAPNNLPQTIPALFFGTVVSIENESLTIKESMEPNNEFKISKSEINKIVLNKKNPDFDGQKAEEIDQEIAKALNSIASENVDPATFSPQIPPELEEKRKDPSVQQYLKEESSWENLKAGMRLDITTDPEGKKEIEAYEL